MTQSLKLALAGLFLFGITHLDAQEIGDAYQKQIDNYKQGLSSAISEQDFQNAAGISGKIAYIYWDHRRYDEAIDFFNQSIDYNTKTGNKNGIKSAYFNLGLIKIDTENYESALADFQKGTDYAKELGRKNDILSGLINSASIQQSLGRNEDAIATALQALNLAQELENVNLTKRCYGILYESYQAAGNSEKSIEYFDLYSTVDRFLRDEQAKQIEQESQQKVAQIASAKALTDQKLASSTQQLLFTQDSLRRAEEVAERQKLQLKLNEVTLREQEAQLENERLIRNGLIVITGLTIVFFIILYIQYRQKKQKNILLEEQNRMINEQKEEIEKQGEYLAIKNEELSAVNKEKNLMMSMVAHDLKKPINDLTALSQILTQYEDKLPDDFNHLVSVLKKSSQGYRDMVHKVLDAGAIESRKLNVVEEKLNLKEVLINNAESQSIPAGDKKISFDLSEVPESAHVKADKIYLSQAIENILYNAVKYSPEDSTIYLSAIRENGSFKIGIRDEGPGITEEDQKYLFETFKPLKNGDKESTGLGLSISKKYIEAMGGSISCESKVGNGTTFFLNIEKW